jgi:HK97 family phage major capsid protein
MSPVVTSSPRLYREDGDCSFFADSLRAYGRSGDYHDRDGAERRLARHRHEEDVEWRRAHGNEKRTNPFSSATAPTFAPPAWLIDKFSTPARAGRVLGDLATPMPLPPYRSSVHIPQIVSGGGTDIQPAQGDPVYSTDMVTADASSPVVTIAGLSTVSLQLFDLTPAPFFDQVAFVDFSTSYNARLESQLIAGTGTNGQLTGIANTAGISTVTYTSGSPTLPGAWAAIAQGVAAVGNTRLQPATAVLMAPRRWAWIAGSVDDQHRPIVTPDNNPEELDPRVAGGTEPVGPIAGKPVYEDGGIPASAYTDPVYAIRPSDFLLLESEPRLTVVPNAGSGTLSEILVYHRYVAFVVQQATAIAVVTGTGFAQPSGY